MDGFSVYTSPKGYKHLVSYGMTVLYGDEEAFGSEWNGASLHIGAESMITALLVVADTELEPQTSVYGKTEFIQLIGITEAELQAFMSDENNVNKLIEMMKADGNVDLVTDMKRSKSYF